MVTPNTRTSIGPRIDYQLSTNNTLVARFEYGWNSRENIGRRRLPPAPALRPGRLQFHRQQSELNAHRNLDANPKIVNETRFQYTRTYSTRSATCCPRSASPAHSPAAAPTKAPTTIRSSTSSCRTTLPSCTAPTPSATASAPGARATAVCRPTASAAYSPSWALRPGAGRQQQHRDRFQRQSGPDHPLTAVPQYTRTLAPKGRFTPAQIRLLGGGASQFNIDAGNPYSSITAVRCRRLRAGRLAHPPQPHLQLRPALRMATNITDHRDFAPRLGFAWAPGTAKDGRQKTVVRGGFGMFYDRVADTLIERACLLNGTNQLSYTLTNPDTFPNAPPRPALPWRRTASIASIPTAVRLPDADGHRRGAPVAAQYHPRGHLHQPTPCTCSRPCPSTPRCPAPTLPASPAAERAPTASPPAISSSTNPAASCGRTF